MDFSPLRQWSFIGTEGSSACWKSHPSRDVCCTPTGTHSSSWNINCPARMQTVPGKQTAFAIKAFSEVRSVIQDSTHSLLHPDSPCTDVHSGAKPQDAAARGGGGTALGLGGEPGMSQCPLSHTWQSASAERGRDRSRCTHKRTLQIRLAKRSR